MKKQSFKEIYLNEKAKPSNAQQFITRIAQETHSSEWTVKSWLKGRRNPTMLVQELLAKKFKTPADVLFPHN